MSTETQEQVQVQAQQEPSAQQTIPELLQALREARNVYALRREAVNAKLDAFQAENADLIQAESEAKDAAAQLEQTIKQALVVHFKADPDQNKKPFPGTGIRVSTKTTCIYDADKALAWAKEHDMCLTLDAKAFEATAEAGAVKADWLELRKGEVVTATIATDLDKALGEKAQG